LTLILLLLIPGVPIPGCNAAPSSTALPAIRFSYPAVEDPTVTLGKYQPILDAMAAAVGRPVSIVLRNTYGEIVQDLGRGDADVGILNAFSYVDIVSRAKLSPWSGVSRSRATPTRATSSSARTPESSVIRIFAGR
jgi:ABC-type phosphate/phosphonate transport system substrate-binding protein